MRIETIIRNSLKFLEDDFNFKYEVSRDKGTTYTYTNKYGRFEYYQWQQFGESRFSVFYEEEYKIVNMFHESPREIGKFNSQSKGFKIFLKDRRQKYWYMIAKIIKSNIKDTGTLFGLRVN